MTEPRRHWQWHIPAGNGHTALSWMAAETGLSKQKLKDAMAKGAVWLGRKGQKRLRRATAELQAGDELQLYYDPALLARTPPEPRLVADCRHYSVWYKPPGMLAQGSQWGDHCALTRWVEKHFTPPRDVHLVHRLDREASGLMLMAHSPQAAARLGDLFQRRDMDKRYRVLAAGRVGEPGETQVIDLPLDGKPSRSHVTVLALDDNGNSLLDIRLESGRKHQIRRHLAESGHPVLGDPRYGLGYPHPAGLQLRAWRLAFRCPFSRQPKVFEVAASE